MKAILSRATLGTQPGSRPPAAVEITAGGVLAAAIPAPGQETMYAFEPLPAGALVPLIGEPNLRMPDEITAAIRSTLGQVSARSRAITLIVPDTVVRVFVLDFDSLPAKPVEAYPVLRFRLRKMVPFDVEHAGISYQILNETRSETKVLAAVLPGPILGEYESAVRAAGYEPGAVLPSSLAALETINSLEAALVANMSPVALTTCITNGQNLLLYRTLDLPEDPRLRIDEVRRGVAVAAAYFEDKLGARPTHLQFAGSFRADDWTSGSNAESFARWIDNPDLTVEDLAPRPTTGAVTSLGNTNVAGVAGALAGVR